MLEENKNPKNSLLKDITSVPAPYEANGFRLGSYSKLSKLITALYMVTDIMDREEPLRNKLRTLGLNILSDTHFNSPLEGCLKGGVDGILSLLDIASSMRMISEMNSNILKKEFLQLKQSTAQDNPMWLEEFLNSPLEEYPEARPQGVVENFPPRLAKASHPSRGELNSIGHIGVQKGSTLMKALRDVKASNRNPFTDKLGSFDSVSSRSGFDVLKKQRREEILKIIKTYSSSGATITDIKTSAIGSLASCGEKTLQRELVSMTHDGVLEKTGEKRWSRYSFKR